MSTTKLTLRPAGGFGLSPKDEMEVLRQFFGLTSEQVKTNRRLQRHGQLYLTEGAIAPCEYQVIVRQGFQVPHQYEMGMELCQILIHRIDGQAEPYYWQDMQEIKDAVIGIDREALELYPAAHRRMHHFPFRALWGIVSGEIVPLGWPKSGAK